MTVPIPDEFFALSQTRHGGTTVVAAAGEIDALTAPQLSAALDAALAASDDALVVDLSGVSFFSSVGLTVLARAAATPGRDVRIVVGDSRPVGRALELTGLNRVLELHETLDSAVAARSS